MNPEVLQQILQQQQQQFLAALQAMQVQAPPLPANAQPNPAPIDRLMQSLSLRLSEFVYDPDENDTFDRWYARYQDVFTADAEVLDDATKARLLVSRLGKTEFQRFANNILPQQPRDISFDDTVAKLQSLFAPTHSLFNRRYKCLQLVRDSSTDVVTFSGIVNKQCELFQLDALTTEQFKALVFISALKNPSDAELRLQCLKKLETTPTATLQELVQVCHRYQTFKEDLQMLDNPSAIRSADVSALRQSRSEAKNQRSSSQRPRSSSQYRARSSSRPLPKHARPCRFCQGHHWDKDCRQASSPSRRPRQTQLPWKPSTGSIWISHLSLPPSSLPRVFQVLQVKGSPVKFQVDSGADISLINKETWVSLGQPTLRPARVSGTSADASPIRFLGVFQCRISLHNSSFHGTLYVVRNGKNLMGLDFMGALHFSINHRNPQVQAIGVNNQSLGNQSIADRLQQAFPSVFSECLGLFKLQKAHLQLKDNIQPVFCPKRPVAYGAVEVVNKELDRLLNLNVIEAVNYAEWAAPILVVTKANGSARMCIDFSTGLNNALLQHQYPLPLPETLFASLNGARFFSKLDLADAYLQIELDEESKKLAVINTHRGLFRYNRLPFGVKSAPGIFQQLMDTLLSGIPGAVAYLDDIIIVGSSIEEHNSALLAVFNRIRDAGLQVRLSKCEFFLPSVKYLGFIVDKDGRRPDPQKTAAISNMPSPTDVSTLRAFLGMISYYGQFVDDMRQVRAPLDELLKKDVPFVWSVQCEEAVQTAKRILQSDLLLTHYNPKLPIIVAADASKEGIGAVISHRFPDGSEKAICHASYALSPAEKKYSQIEKEGLALIFAVKKFHRMIYGRRFLLLTDHKPLLSIFGSKKGIPVHSANRLQRWAITLLGYHFSIEYRKSDEFGQADALSRLIAAQPDNSEDRVVASLQAEHEICLPQLPPSIFTVSSNDVSSATFHDETLQEVLSALQNGWPEDISPKVMPYYNRRNGLSALDGCILYVDRLIIPQSLRLEVLRLLHESHPGIVRMKSLARQHVYWPGIDSDIEHAVRQCSSCAVSAKSPPNVSVPWPPSKKPWSRIHIDFAQKGTQMFLVVVDSFSKWPEIILVSSATSSSVIKELLRLFSAYGLPEIIVSDNGRQFKSSEFAGFCKTNGISHLFAPPYHPQSNGQAERFVDIFKRNIDKFPKKGGIKQSIEALVFGYRSTPCTALPNQSSPAELFLGRRLRTPLSLLRPSLPDYSSSPSVVPRPSSVPFVAGQDVYARSYSQGVPRWVAATIQGRIGSVLYSVRMNGHLHQRHVSQIRRREIPASSASSQPLDQGLILEEPENPATRPRRVSFAAPTDPIPNVSSTGPPRSILRSRTASTSSPANQFPSFTPRRSDRLQKPRRFLVVDPKKKSYEFEENGSSL